MYLVLAILVVQSGAVMNQMLPRFLAVFLFSSSLLSQSLTASATVKITGIWQWGWHKMIFNGVQTYSPGGTLRIKQSGKLIHFQLSLTAGLTCLGILGPAET